MTALQITLSVALLVLLTWRLAQWWHRLTLDRVINEKLAQRGLQVSEEMAFLLRRPTVDGVARKMIRKMGLCAHADIMLLGTTITLVCHDKALLQRAVDAITGQKVSLQDAMTEALTQARAAGVIAHLEAQKPKRFVPPPIAETPKPADPFKVLDGGVR